MMSGGFGSFQGFNRKPMAPEVMKYLQALQGSRPPGGAGQSASGNISGNISQGQGAGAGSVVRETALGPPDQNPYGAGSGGIVQGTRTTTADSGGVQAVPGTISAGTSGTSTSGVTANPFGAGGDVASGGFTGSAPRSYIDPKLLWKISGGKYGSPDGGATGARY